MEKCVKFVNKTLFKRHSKTEIHLEVNVQSRRIDMNNRTRFNRL